jgi:hypothetical protein
VRGPNPSDPLPLPTHFILLLGTRESQALSTIRTSGVEPREMGTETRRGRVLQVFEDDHKVITWVGRSKDDHDAIASGTLGIFSGIQSRE